MNITKPSVLANRANDYAERFYGTRATNHLEEGDSARATFKANALDEFISLTEEIKRLVEENYPTLKDHSNVEVFFHRDQLSEAKP